MANSSERGQAVEPSSRVNPSRCVRKCRFPLLGGLHRSSLDSPAATPPIPDWCFVNKSNSTSSMRTRVAATAFLSKAKEGTPIRSQSHKRVLNHRRKHTKQRRLLKDVHMPSTASGNVKRLSLDFLKKHVVICDGGVLFPTINSSNFNSTASILSISKGDLWVHDTTNSQLGLRMELPNSSPTSPVFIRLPRTLSLEINKDGYDVCRAMKSCARTQPQSLARGVSNQVFSDRAPRYYCVGCQASRAERGVKDGQYKLKYGFPSHDWDVLLALTRRAEHAFDAFCSTNMIRHIVAARDRVPFLTMAPASSSSSGQESARYYNGTGFGLNVFLRTHVDSDFTMSIVQVHTERSYTADDPISCYFCFPRLGIAVPLRPGDFFVFNPQEPHCISSRCNLDDDVYSISCYLKTRVVGLNDNSNVII